MNCNRCEKCVRSIVALAVGGVDPAACGFIVDSRTQKYIMNLLEARKISNSQLAFWWGPMQRAIPDPMPHEMFGMKSFLEWFRTFDLGNGLDPRPSLLSFERLYPMFPYPVSLAIRSIIYSVIRDPNAPVSDKAKTINEATEVEKPRT